MHKLITALALACALSFAGTAAAVDFGANDDTGKFAEDGGVEFFGQMAAAGLKQNVITVRWTPGSSEIPDRELLERAVPAATEAGIRPVFAVYPYPPSAIATAWAGPSGFADWLEGVALAFPQVTTYIVGNEPNLNTFWRPQGNGKGMIRSGSSFGPYLAAGYDALKGVSPRDHRARRRRVTPRRPRPRPGGQGLADALHLLARLLVPQEPAAGAADGRLQLPPLSEPQ